MGRAPCCEKMGLKKGPWTPEEDNILVTYIQQYGHGNWRALPKLAGLLRCGKSCRLRWTNYLRPDIKRGNFSREEEDAIINLHQMLGNRWSAIAARLPGRTDNEIKNVWHTHLKKRLKHTTAAAATTATAKTEQDPKPFNAPSFSEESEVLDCGPVSPPQCTSSDTSSATTSGGSISNTDVASMKLDDFEASLPEADESFWSEVLSAENPDQMVNEFPAIDGSPEVNVDPINEFSLDSLDMYTDNNMDFWFNIFPGAEEIPELLEIPEL